MEQRPKVLFALTSQATIPTNGNQTGFYLPELVHPYNAISPHADIIIASPVGGEAPVDPYSIEATKDDTQCVTFLKEKSSVWKNTEKLESILGRASEFAAVFYVGGHGPMFDLANNEISHKLIREFYEGGKFVSAVCHGPIALANVKLSDGNYMVANQTVTGLSNAEEDALQATEYMPCLLETVLKDHGGLYVKAENLFGVNVVVSGAEGRLITGQNPPSAGVIGDVLLKAMNGLRS